MKNNHSRSTAIADRASSATLAFLGAVHITVLAVTMLLVFTLSSQAQTASAPACKGTDLLVEMAKSDPAQLADINAQAAKVPFGQGKLFKLEKPGIEPSYLFGTMHMADPRIVELPDAAQKAFDASSILAIESTEILDPAKAQVALMSNPELTMFTGDKRLSDFLDADDKKVLADGLAEKGMQLALIDRMKPWLLTGMIALPECEFARKQAGEPFLDITLAQKAEAQNKELVGLETIVEQFEAMASLPMKFHVQGLIDTLALGDKMDDVTETMISLYIKGETGKVWPMLKAFAKSTGTDNQEATEGYAAFEEKLVNTRNLVMLERSLPLLERGKAFIAVGALHLPGEKGLAQLYQDAGYTVTAVK